MTKGPARSGGLKQRVKTARKRTLASTRWLERQLNDPYVAAAKAQGYRGRAAFKLKELDEKYRLLKPGMTVLDLGAAPGGWTQIALERIGAKGRVVGIDILEMQPIVGSELLQMDFLAEDAPARLRTALGGRADIVLSDMAANTTGHRPTDHIRTMTLAEAAFDFACEVLKPGGAFVAKVFKGGTEGALLARMKQAFAVVRHAKPPASRQESTEAYVVATGFRGLTAKAAP